MTAEQAAANRALLTRLSKQANQRLVRLERAKAEKKEGFLTGAMNYAHRALGQVGRKRFEEHNKNLSDKQVSAALRRVSRFLNMPESTLFGQKVTMKALEKYNEARGAKGGPGVLESKKTKSKLAKKKEKREAGKLPAPDGQKGREADGAYAGPGVLGAKQKNPVPKTEMEKRRKNINYERYKQLTYRALQTGISKTFTYETIKRSIMTGVQNGFSDEDIMDKVVRMSEDDDLTRQKLLDAFGDEAAAAAEEAEAEQQFSKEDLERWKISAARRRKTDKVRRSRKSQPPRRK